MYRHGPDGWKLERVSRDVIALKALAEKHNCYLVLRCITLISEALSAVLLASDPPFHTLEIFSAKYSIL